MARATEVCIKLVQIWAAVGPGEPKPQHGPESPADTGAAVDWTDAIYDLGKVAIFQKRWQPCP
jgi:hypothetical protein